MSFKLHQFGVMIFESLFEALAAQLAPLDFGGIGSRLPDGGERCGLGLLRDLTGRDLGHYGGVARRSIGIRAEREIFGDALAEHFELGRGAGALGDGRFDRLLLLLAGRVETGAAGVERVAFLLLHEPFGADRGLVRQGRPAGRLKRRSERRFDFRKRRLDLGAGSGRVVAAFEAFELGQNPPPAVFEFAPAGQKRVSLGGVGHARRFQEGVTLCIERLALFLPWMHRGRHGHNGEIADGDFRRRQNGRGVAVFGAQRADAHLSSARWFHLDHQRRCRCRELRIERRNLPVQFVEVLDGFWLDANLTQLPHLRKKYVSLSTR
jgi:hypothetical protein